VACATRRVPSCVVSTPPWQETTPDLGLACPSHVPRAKGGMDMTRWAFFFVAAGCVGDRPSDVEEGRCRDPQDCHGGQTCSPEPPPPPARPDATGSAACFAPIYECTADTDCGTATVCVMNPAAGCGGYGSQCLPTCTAASCPQGERCGSNGHCVPLACDTEAYVCPDGFKCDRLHPASDAHRCAPIHCNDGFVCPAYQQCSSIFPGHGCTLIGCALDQDCPMGRCVNGSCAADFGYCQAFQTRAGG
jgi:hypothetical protein